jgi:beta-galactosidase/beta-glucuronidase
MALNATVTATAAVCACRNAGFLANVQAELTQQLMRLGSHASLVVFGGNNEVEQSLEWYEETRGNLAMYAADYSALFEDTIGPLVQKVGGQQGAEHCASEGISNR